MIKLEHVYYRYKEGNYALSDINLEFKKGEISFIIGSNGSGKSSLLSSIAGLNKYDGLITLDNKNIKKFNNKELRKKIGIVFQNPNTQMIFNNVYDDMKFTLNNLDEDNIDEKIKKSLKLVGMSDFINANPYNLSMGQKQKINLAGILGTDKEFLLLDEVTSMIDNSGKNEIYQIIKKLKKLNKGIIMTTNLTDELIYADKIIILNKYHQVDGVYTKEEIFKHLEYLNDFYVPLKFKIINKIGYEHFKDLSDEEFLNYVN